MRPVFYSAEKKDGLMYLGIENPKKPVLVVIGGSLGARQINELVLQNMKWLCEHFIVVHQTGAAFAEEYSGVLSMTNENYKPYAFIYSEMPSVLQAADVVLSRAGANSLWECAVLGKPMVLIPLSGSGTRGDQVENASYFAQKGAAAVLSGEEADGEHLKATLEKMLDTDYRKKMGTAAASFAQGERPARKIAEILFEGLSLGAKNA